MLLQAGSARGDLRRRHADQHGGRFAALVAVSDAPDRPRRRAIGRDQASRRDVRPFLAGAAGRDEEVALRAAATGAATSPGSAANAAAMRSAATSVAGPSRAARALASNGATVRPASSANPARAAAARILLDFVMSTSSGARFGLSDDAKLAGGSFRPLCASPAKSFRRAGEMFRRSRAATKQIRLSRRAPARTRSRRRAPS